MELTDFYSDRFLPGNHIDEVQEKIVPLLIETDDLFDIKEFRNKFFESGDYWVLEILTDAMIERDRWDEFKICSVSFLTKCNDSEWVCSAAARWLQPAVQHGCWGVVKSCWEILEKSDYFYDNADEVCNDLVPIVFQKHGSAELAEIRKLMLSSHSLTFREALADKLAEQSQWNDWVFS